MRATNAVGDGLFTEASFVAAAAVPTPPTALRVTKTTASSVTLAWEVPEDTNGAPVTNYTVESAQDVDSTRGFWPAFVGRELRSVCVVALLHFSCTVHAIPSESAVSFVCCGCHTSCTLRGLHPETTYKYRVLAENTVGKSTHSEIVEATTQGKLPSQPDAPFMPPVRVSCHTSAAPLLMLLRTRALVNSHPTTVMAGCQEGSPAWCASGVAAARRMQAQARHQRAR